MSWIHPYWVSWKSDTTGKSRGTGIIVHLNSLHSMNLAVFGIVIVVRTWSLSSFICGCRICETSLASSDPNAIFSRLAINFLAIWLLSIARSKEEKPREKNDEIHKKRLQQNATESRAEQFWCSDCNANEIHAMQRPIWDTFSELPAARRRDREAIPDLMASIRIYLFASWWTFTST